MKQTIKMEGTIRKRFEELSQDVALSMLYQAKNRLRNQLNKLEILLKESLEEKSKFLLGAFYFLPDEILDLIKQGEEFLKLEKV